MKKAVLPSNTPTFRCSSIARSGVVASGWRTSLSQLCTFAPSRNKNTNNNLRGETTLPQDHNFFILEKDTADQLDATIDDSTASQDNISNKIGDEHRQHIFLYDDIEEF
jgi:hypothetical protein